MYLTHYGRSSDVPRLGALLLGQLDEMVALRARALPRRRPTRHQALQRGLARDPPRAACARTACTLTDERIRELLALDLELNAQGIAIWLDRTER